MRTTSYSRVTAGDAALKSAKSSVFPVSTFWKRSNIETNTETQRSTNHDRGQRKPRKGGEVCWREVSEKVVC